MMVLVSYDVSTESYKGNRRLRRVAKTCEDYGQRVQSSVFECIVDPSQWLKLKTKLEKEINPDVDSLRFYYLGSNWKRKIEHVGVKSDYEPEEPLIL